MASPPGLYVSILRRQKLDSASVHSDSQFSQNLTISISKYVGPIALKSDHPDAEDCYQHGYASKDLDVGCKSKQYFTAPAG